MNAMYVFLALAGVFFIVYGALIHEELVPELTLKQLSAGLMTFFGLTLVLAAKVFNDGEKNGNQNEN